MTNREIMAVGERHITGFVERYGVALSTKVMCSGGFRGPLTDFTRFPSFSSAIILTINCQQNQ